MALVLVYDGGCPFCCHFALRAELVGGLPGLEIRDGRADHGLRSQLNARGLDLARGAVLLEGEQAWHGAEAIAELCRRLRPSDPLLGVLARRLALQWKGLPEDPDQAGLRQA
jgi:predicted DCC family thiol-disulfide oxidoreductase YuxK